MKHRLHFYSLLLILSQLFPSCEEPPDLPADSEGAPALTLRLKIDNTDSLVFKAGFDSDMADHKLYPFMNDPSKYCFITTMTDSRKGGKGTFTFIVYDHRFPVGNVNEDLAQTLGQEYLQYEHNTDTSLVSKVRIEWQKDSTAFFSTRWMSQPSSKFRIEKTETLSRDGYRYIKAVINIDCILQDPYTLKDHAVSGQGILAFRGGKI
jgi:hypothetical protein